MRKQGVILPQAWRSLGALPCSPSLPLKRPCSFSRSRTIDTANAFNGYAVKTLQDIDDRRRNPQPLLDFIRTFTDPFAVLGPLDIDLSEKDEKEMKDVFIITANGIGGKIHSITNDCFDLGHMAENIQQTLDRIQEPAINDLDELPQISSLEALRNSVAHRDKYQQYQSHSTVNFLDWNVQERFISDGRDRRSAQYY